MCGLAGVWQPGGGDSAELRAHVRAMAGTLIHRGPDDGGEFVDAGSGIALGFRRLAIVDLSPAGHQPMGSADGRYVLLFNGEIYNHRDLRARLAGEGASFRGTSDTEVIVELIARQGVRAAVPELWGMFALAIWDAHERALWLVRDRLGKKPLYYGRSRDGAWLFGSELKSLRAHPGCPAAVDRAAVADLLRYGCIPAPASIYEGIGKLPPGHLVRLAASGGAAPEAYWRARSVVEAAVDARRPARDADAIEEGEALLRDAVRRRMIADVPFGAFLSGGLDSTAVVALMQAESGERVRTFTIGFADAAYDEAGPAAAVAAHLGTDHTSLQVTASQALEVIPALPAIFDEPFADASQIPTAIVAALARSHVTVALTGDGGDEMFGGYTRHVWAERAWRRIQPWPSSLRRLVAAAGARVGPRTLDRAAAAGQRLLPGRTRQRHPGEKARKLLRLLEARDADEVYDVLLAEATGTAAAPSAGAGSPAWWRGEAAGLRLPTVAERIMFQDLVGYLPDDILVKVDRATMAVGLEARAPLLDHRLVEFMWQLPLAFRIRDGRGKWLLRRIVERHVPGALIDRPKTGFGLPIGDWLRGPLRDWAEPLLAPAALEAGGLDAASISAAWQAHLAGGPGGQPLWPVLMLQAWRQRWC